MELKEFCSVMIDIILSNYFIISMYFNVNNIVGENNSNN